MTLLWFVHSQAWYRRACSHEALHDYAAACSNAAMAVKLSRYIMPTLTCQASSLPSVARRQASPELVLSRLPLLSLHHDGINYTYINSSMCLHVYNSCMVFLSNLVEHHN